MIIIRSIIEKGGPGQITCNYHTIIPDTVACTIFNMLFVTFGGGHSASHVRAFIHSLFLSYFFYHSLSLFFSLENTHFRQQWTTNLDPIQCLYVHKNLFFFYFFKNAYSIVRIFLLLSLTLFLFLCAHPPPIFSLYTLPRHQLDSKSRHALPCVSKRETEKLIKVNYDQTRGTIRDLSVLLVEELIQTSEIYSKNLFEKIV